MKSVLKIFLVTIFSIILVACSSGKKANNTDVAGLSGEFGGYSASDLQNRYNTIHFNFDSYDITSEGMQILDAHALLLNKYTGNIQVEGHADERGSSEYNIALGQNRANAVKSYLTGKGISGNRISTISYGKEKPAVLGHDESAYYQNRRGVINYQ